MPTLTKTDIAEALYANASGFSKREATEAVQTLYDVIKETLERGESVKIAGFGSFIVRDKKARVGRNPQTGAEIQIAARRVVTFKASDQIKKRLSSSESSEGGSPE
jgi:integration host factor subunit alpha